MRTDMARALLAHIAASLAGISLFLGLTLFATPSSRAQVRITGQISGTVVDSSGAVVPRAVVKATDAATGASQTVTASASGVYVFPALQPGTYQLEATAKGFATAIYSNVVVSAAQTTDVQITMKIGAVSETVQVSAAGQILKTSEPTLATTISPTLVENLPLNGRDLLEFATLVSGAANPDNQQRYTTYNNLPAASNNITVNGTNDNFQRFKTFSTGFFTAAPLREGAFEEATVSTSDLSSDAGSASLIRFVTKRGTKQFHGRVFWQTVNSFFNANSFTNNALAEATQGAQGRLPKTRNNFYGGNFGGPLLPNGRAFFFVNLEYNRVPSVSFRKNLTLTNDAASGLYTYDVTAVPASTPSWVTGCDPVGLTCTADLFALASANGFPAAQDPTIQGLIGEIQGFYSKGTIVPLSTNPAQLHTINEQYLQQLAWARPGLTKQWFPTTRLDVNLTRNIHWSDSWDLFWRNIANVPNWPGSTFAGNGFKSTYYTWSNTVDWTISPTMLNTASFGIESNVEEFNPGAVPDPFKSQGERVIGGPNFDNNHVFSFTAGPSVLSPIPGFILPVPRNNPQFNPSDTLTWTRGNHTFNFGGNVSYSNMHELEQNDPPIYATSASTPTGLAFGDAAASMFTSANFPNVSGSNGNRDLIVAAELYASLTGRLAAVNGNNFVDLKTGTFPPAGALVAKEAQTRGFLFFQDSWHVRRDFTLNYGLNWNLTGPIHNTNNSFFAPTFRDLLGPSTGLFQPGVLNGTPNPQVLVRPSQYPGDYVQPRPNIGFAWNPDISEGWLGRLFGGRKTAIRGGAALASYDEGWETFENVSIFGNPGDTNSIAYFAGMPSGAFPPGSQFLSDPTLDNRVNATSFPPTFETSLPMSAFTFTGQSYGVVDPNIRSPYIEEWNFGVQREVPWNTVVEVNYVGNHGIHEWQTFTQNEVNATSNGFLTQFQAAQANLIANGGKTFADNTGAPGVVATPLFDVAFSGNGVTTSATDTSGYANNGFIFDLQTGQAGAMATSFAGSSIYLCNMVGANLSPCGNTGSGAFPINYFQANPFAAGVGANLLSDPASSSYNALQISVRHPTGHGLSLGANYTFSKSLGSRFLSFFTDTGQENYISLRNMGLNKGPSDNDIRHVMNVYFSYDLPFGRGQQFNFNNSVVENIVGGWNLGGIFTFETGIPFWMQGGFSSFNDEDGGVVLTGTTYKQVQHNIGVFTTTNGFDPVHWLNSKFDTSTIQPEQTPGVIGNLLFFHGPKFVNTDLSLTKTIPIWEKVRLSIQASFLNAFNHPNWSVGNNSAPGFIVFADSSLSQPSAISANSPRAIQFRTQLQF